jgi:CheY-like chemotaxis protein
MIREDAAGDPGGAQARKQTILVVDDSITIRTLQHNILDSAGYRVLVAGDGEEALELLQPEPHVDLIITDIQMPRMDGAELCRRLRQGRHAATPVVMVTSMGSEEEIQLGMEAGADAYIVKGRFEQQHYLATVRRLIEQG